MEKVRDFNSPIRADLRIGE